MPLFSCIYGLKPKNRQILTSVIPDRFNLYASMLINIRDGLAINSVMKYKLERINVSSVQSMSKYENGIFVKNALYSSGSSRVIKYELMRLKVESLLIKSLACYF